MIDPKFSFAPFGEPGNVTMSVLFLTPATGRDMTANEVTASDAESIPCTRPGACLCISGDTASGVTSFVVKPVPPLVTIKFAGSGPSARSVMER